MRVAYALSVALTVSGCIDALDHKELVQSPRILEIVAEPPEIGPGQSSRLRVYVGGATGVMRQSWFWCVNNDANVTGFGAADPDNSCFRDAGRARVSLGNDATAVFSVPAQLLDLNALATRFGGQLPPGFLETYVRDIGVAVGVGVTVDVDGRTLDGFKRVVVSLNPHPNHNPPPPRLRLHQAWTTLRGHAGDDCVPESGDAIRVMRGAAVNLSPDPDESWFESYRVLMSNGVYTDRQERAFYSWYATGGSLSDGLTQSPLRDTTWRAPSAPGPQSLWLFVRDGRGGVSGCRVPVTVE